MEKAKFQHLEESEKLEEIWKETYKERRKKVSRQRAIVSANARVYAEALKTFAKKPEKKIPAKLNENKKDYKTYRVGDSSIIISTEEKLLRDYPMAERKGKLRSMDDAFEREILSRLIDDYEVQVHPDMYYVINGET